MCLASPELHVLAQTVLDRCRARRWRIGVAESCTGGLVTAALTDIPGSSEVVDRGFVTYSDRAKVELLGVNVQILVQHGAVSAETAAAMVEGVLAKSKVDVAAAVTGIAGPGGGSAAKPVGLVWFGVMRRGGEPRVERHVFAGDAAGARAARRDRGLAAQAGSTTTTTSTRRSVVRIFCISPSAARKMRAMRSSSTAMVWALPLVAVRMVAGPRRLTASMVSSTGSISSRASAGAIGTMSSMTPR
jgi:nicotinamide-nucleotide amidase